MISTAASAALVALVLLCGVVGRDQAVRALAAGYAALWALYALSWTVYAPAALLTAHGLPTASVDLWAVGDGSMAMGTAAVASFRMASGRPAAWAWVLWGTHTIQCLMHAADVMIGPLDWGAYRAGLDAMFLVQGAVLLGEGGPYASDRIRRGVRRLRGVGRDAPRLAQKALTRGQQ